MKSNDVSSRNVLCFWIFLFCSALLLFGTTPSLFASDSDGHEDREQYDDRSDDDRNDDDRSDDDRSDDDRSDDDRSDDDRSDDDRSDDDRSDDDDDDDSDFQCDIDALQTDETYHYVIVKLDVGVRDPELTLQMIVEQYDHFVAAYTVIESRHIYALQLLEPYDDPDDVNVLLDEAWLTNGVLYIAPDYTGNSDYDSAWVFGELIASYDGDSLPTGSDPTSIETQYAFDMLKLDNAHDTSTGEGIIVAVIDTGIEHNHPFFLDENGESIIVSGWDFVDDDDDPAEEPFLDDVSVATAFGHGTHVAGIIHAVAPDAKIMPVRALDATGQGSIFAIAEGILYAAENGAHIINLSLGTPYDAPILKEAVKKVYHDYDVLVVAAAGNDDSCRKQYPAAYDEDDLRILAVTAIDEEKDKMGAANYGRWVDIAAPGENILSPTFNPYSSEYHYASWSGTSMATPFVSGEAALLAALASSHNRAERIHNIIVDKTQSIESEYLEYSAPIGKGIPDYAHAVAEMR